MNIDTEASGPDPQAPALASVWTRPQRQRKEQLTRERIVAEAIRLLDEEGLEALSMRTLGQRLGAGATSLYRHVASKDELIELVADAVYGEIEVPEIVDPSTWRLALHAVAHSLRMAGLRHMWMGQALGQVGMTYVGPNVVGVTARTLGILTMAGFSEDEAAKALGTVSSYVLGATAAESGWLSALRRNGYEEKDWMRIIGPTVVESVADSGLTEFYLEQLKRDPQEVRMENFSYGLDLIIDSLQARLAARLADTGDRPTAESKK
ncbi:TetR/AcrR family transcriptional regulator [Catenulispora subtropica]|uniref:HTH tetR-type domain-containing protein n=1 Tax=Catenulispora subtropica TaxID=450798 RepID=A0ABN2QUS9_9ACTN